MSARELETRARFVCKSCGAESPAGIGYVCTTSGPLPVPAAGCPGPHAGAVHMVPWQSGAPTVCGFDGFPRAVNAYRESVTCSDCLAACDAIPAVGAWDELTRGFWEGGRRVTAGELRPGDVFRHGTLTGYVVARLELIPAWNDWPETLRVHCRGRRRADGSRCGSTVNTTPATFVEVTR